MLAVARLRSGSVAARVYAWLLAQSGRWARRDGGVGTSVGNIAWIVIALVVIVFAILALGPLKTWVASIFNSITGIQPPTIPST